MIQSTNQNATKEMRFTLRCYCLVLSAALLLVSLLPLWASEPESVKPFSALLPKAAFEMIQKNRGKPDFVIIDIRTPAEFADGYIEGAININYNDESFLEQLDRLDKTKTYVIYCRTGRRSSDALNVMIRLGFKNVYRITGDIVRWKAEGLPTLK
jgi:rhodanese-related sulfurtransferase